MQKGSWSLATVLLLVLAGCATYQPPALKYGETATIQGQVESSGYAVGAVTLRKIDALPVGSGQDEIAVLSAGCHTIDFTYDVEEGYRRSRKGDTTVSFQAVGGKTYVIRAGIPKTPSAIPGAQPVNLGLFQTWVEDGKTHQPVISFCKSATGYAQ